MLTKSVEPRLVAQIVHLKPHHICAQCKKTFQCLACDQKPKNPLCCMHSIYEMPRSLGRDRGSMEEKRPHSPKRHFPNVLKHLCSPKCVNELQSTIKCNTFWLTNGSQISATLVQNGELYIVKMGEMVLVDFDLHPYLGKGLNSESLGSTKGPIPSLLRPVLPYVQVILRDNSVIEEWCSVKAISPLDMYGHIPDDMEKFNFRLQNLATDKVEVSHDEKTWKPLPYGTNSNQSLGIPKTEWIYFQFSGKTTQRVQAWNNDDVDNEHFVITPEHNVFHVTTRKSQNV